MTLWVNRFRSTHGHVLALDVASVLQATMKSTQTVRVRFDKRGIEKSDHRHRGLLRARCERPSRRAAEQRDEIAALHSITSLERYRSGATVRLSSLTL